MASASAWGIDLGNRALKAIKLVREGDGYRIDDFEIIEHEQILSVAGDNKESLQKTALAHFVERHQTRGSVVGVSVSGQSSFARFIKLPPVEPKKIPEIVRFEAIQQIPFPLDDVEWSYQLFQEKESPDVEVGIFAMRKELVNRQISLFTNLGLNVQVVQMNPLAVYNGMFYDDHVGHTTMFMDSGAENTDLVIADGETVWLRTLPIGGNNFTESLAKSFKLSFAKAEELKRNAATSKYAKQIFQAMRPVFADLVAEIQRSIGFYASVHRDARIQRIIALGSTFQLPGLQKYLQQNLQLPVEKLDAYKAAPPADTKQAADLAENVGTLAGAYGLALQAMGEAKISSSLLPESIRRAKMWQEKTKWFAAAAAMFVLGAVGVGASYYLNSLQYEKNRSVRQNYEETIRQAEQLSNDWVSKVQNQGEEDRAAVRNLRALLDYRGVWPELMTEIISAVPSKSVEELKKVPREQRDLIQIEDIRSQYWADLAAPLDPTANFASYVSQRTTNQLPGMLGRGGRGSDLDAFMAEEAMGRGGGRGSSLGMGLGGDKPKGPRGFLVTIRGSTPKTNQAAMQFVVRTIIAKLVSMNSDAQYKKQKPYYVVRAEVVNTVQRVIENRPGFTSSTPAAPVMPLDPMMEEEGGIYTGPTMVMGRDGKPLFDPMADPVFPGETIKNDTLFTVLAAIALDPPAPTRTE